jgi:hypothetical protein
LRPVRPADCRTRHGFEARLRAGHPRPQAAHGYRRGDGARVWRGRAEHRRDADRDGRAANGQRERDGGEPADAQRWADAGERRERDARGGAVAGERPPHPPPRLRTDRDTPRQERRPLPGATSLRGWSRWRRRARRAGRARGASHCGRAGRRLEVPCGVPGCDARRAERDADQRCARPEPHHRAQPEVRCSAG